jgi:hypothetical protein
MVETTLDRLWIQLWPSAIFTFFLFVKTPEEAMAPSSLSSGEREQPLHEAQRGDRQ